MKIINPNYHNLENKKHEFQENKPFPYIILDNFLESSFYEKLDTKLKKNDYFQGGKKFNTNLELNKEISLNESLPEFILQITDLLNSKDWVKTLKSLTGINKLRATEVGNTMLANYHEMGSDGFLGSHVDHSSDPSTGNPHVLNIILYLSSEWKNDFGGATLFFDKNGKKQISKVEYRANRAVIFLHTPYSFHGVERLKNNGYVKRKLLYVDYYSDSYNPYKNFNLSFPNKWFSHGTTFVLKNNLDYLKKRNWFYAKSLLKYRLNKLRSNF